MLHYTTVKTVYCTAILTLVVHAADQNPQQNQTPQPHTLNTASKPGILYTHKHGPTTSIRQYYEKKAQRKRNKKSFVQPSKNECIIL